jgi:double-stranded uracil-DNA glycosylase
VRRVRSFPPLEDRHARVLILGSMPGAASLAAGQYYAHPRNHFWPIMGRLFGAGPELPYAKRVRRLKSSGVAVWDVLESCVRPGSLDADIEEGSIAINDFAGFFDAHPGIGAVFFNGAKAEAAYRRHVLKGLPAASGALPALRLPSTSPAHAALSLDRKLALWEMLRQ